MIDGDPPVAGWGVLAAPGAVLIAADGGATHARAEGLPVTDVVGDLDSLTPAQLTELTDSGAHIHRFDPDKDFTDFELAVRHAARSVDQATTPERPALLIVGGAGGRLDHELGNIAILAGDGLAGFDITALLGNAIVRVARPDVPVLSPGRSDRAVSLVPVGGTARGVTTRGLQYRLHGEDLEPASSRGISNRATEPTVHVSVTDGILLVIEPDAVDDLTDRCRQ